MWRNEKRSTKNQTFRLLVILYIYIYIYIKGLLNEIIAAN